MKIKTFASLLALLLLCLATQHLATAQTAGQSTKGSYQFSLEDGYTKYTEFDAATQTDGSATGSMFFSDEAKITIQDVDGTGDKEVTYPGFSIKVGFDSLVVNRNQAVMSGTVTDSSIRDYIGQRVLLTVEDNGDNTKVADKLTWGIYKPVVRDWTPSDAELKVDPGVGMRWVATDAERKDDKGITMPMSEAIDTQRFPVSTYSFADIERGAGDILVQP
ncbi:MAG: hypothetical protein QOJ02_3519 [Acidobacteriota bacterium]|jgi:hypothetical protein|nr:hypothetical protein [Acidobacteriota bacterium]